MLSRSRLGLLALVCFVLTAASACNSCGDEKNEGTLLPSDDKIVATVNGTTISEYDVQRAIEASFGPDGAATLEGSARRKVLESLVMSRAIALERDKELDAKARAALDKEVAAYREERLVKSYLAAHAPPDPVTTEMVERYYREHPERFGANQVRSYELIASERELNGEERDALLTALRDPGEKADWSSWAQTLKQRHPVVFTQGRGNESALHPTLRQTLEGLRVGQASSLIFIQNRAYVARVTSVDEQPPRPLAEVSAQIRQTLAPVQIKRALAGVAKQVIAKSQVEYRKP